MRAFTDFYLAGCRYDLQLDDFVVWASFDNGERGFILPFRWLAWIYQGGYL